MPSDELRMADYPRIKQRIYCNQCGARQMATLLKPPGEEPIRIHACAECGYINLAHDFQTEEWLLRGKRELRAVRHHRQKRWKKNMGC